LERKRKQHGKGRKENDKRTVEGQKEQVSLYRGKVRKKKKR